MSFFLQSKSNYGFDENIPGFFWIFQDFIMSFIGNQMVQGPKDGFIEGL